MGSGSRAPEEEEDWEQLLEAMLRKAGRRTGWGTGLLSSAGAMAVSKHRFVRGPRQTVPSAAAQPGERQAGGG